MAKSVLKKEQCAALLAALKTRFDKHRKRHPGIDWADVQERLEAKPAALWSLNEMERTGGEPDVTGCDEATGHFIFCDCAEQTPEGRRACCYDRPGLEKRLKEGLEPNGNVLDMADEMGIEVLDEEQYRELQKLGEFDTKTQSWLKTPENVYKLGGAIFGDRRFGRVFVYHNTAPCFYSGRAFRGLLRV